jgi:hypothetical protein
LKVFLLELEAMKQVLQEVEKEVYPRVMLLWPLFPMEVFLAHLPQHLQTN